MTDIQKTSLAGQLAARFGDTLTITTVRNETVAELAAADLVAVATALRDEPGFRFSELIDLCGVDYLGYGQTEWDTETVSGTGFSRGVEGQAQGRFDWAGRPRGNGENQPRRFAAVRSRIIMMTTRTPNNAQCQGSAAITVGLSLCDCRTSSQ